MAEDVGVEKILGQEFAWNAQVFGKVERHVEIMSLMSRVKNRLPSETAD